MRGEYPRWLRELEGDRPPLSVDVVSEFLLPILERSRAAVFIVVDCLRLDQWMMLAPILAPLFDVETTHHFAVLPTATPYSRNALFSGLFPGEIAARFPDWWGEREDETLNAHEKQLLEAHLAEHQIDVPVRYDKISSANDTADLERRVSGAIAHEGVSAFVFNFVDLLTHGRSESAILQEVAKRRDRAPRAHEAVVRALGAVRAAEGGGAPQASRCSSPAITAPSTATRPRRCSPSATPPRTSATSSARTCAPSARSRRCCSGIR